MNVPITARADFDTEREIVLILLEQLDVLQLTNISYTFLDLRLIQAKLTLFIISMTKLLDADWLRGVQLFH